MSSFDNRLRITEIFYSLQGETTFTGLPTVFVRLTGCPLRCQYCDTAYAFSGGDWLTHDAIVEKVRGFKARYVTVTGGEPLAQKSAPELIRKLLDEGLIVSLETSGAIDISPVDKRCTVILDLKTPDSQESHRNHLENLSHLKTTDEIKFVICSRKDYDWAKEMILQHALTERVNTVLFSPSYQDLAPQQLAEWILEDRLAVRFQMQLHKALWDDAKGK